MRWLLVVIHFKPAPPSQWSSRIAWMYRMAQRGKPQINISEVIPNARKARARFLQRASSAEESALLKAEVQRFCLSARAARKSSRNEENLVHSRAGFINRL